MTRRTYRYRGRLNRRGRNRWKLAARVAVTLVFRATRLFDWLRGVE